jgi:hypothetical protein
MRTYPGPALIVTQVSRVHCSLTTPRNKLMLRSFNSDVGSARAEAHL